MKPENYVYAQQLKKYRLEYNLTDFETGRVIAEHKERYVVATENGEFDAEITGNLRYSAKSREDFPAVGDWVAIKTYDFGVSIIHAVLPRYSVISRQAAGKSGEIQIIAANVDYAFLVQAVDRDFNINRLERYLTICNSAKVNPIIVLSKTDLISVDKKADIVRSIKQRINKIPVLTISNTNLDGVGELKQITEKGKTYCMLGSSGVGKSTLLNNLAGSALMKSGSISESTGKGKHVTTHRELIVLDNGSVIIDNPGMREVGIVDFTDGIEATFDKISQLSKNCKYKDCTHTSEAGCSVIDAVEDGEIDEGLYQNYLKVEKERMYFESSVAERRRKEKSFGKYMKNYKKDMKNHNNKSDY